MIDKIAGSVRVTIPSAQDSEGTNLTTGYKARVEVYEDSDEPLGPHRRPVSLGEYFDWATTPEPVQQGDPNAPRKLFGVFDRNTLQPVYEGSNPTPGQRRWMRLRIISEVIGGGVHQAVARFKYPFYILSVISCALSSSGYCPRGTAKDST